MSAHDEAVEAAKAVLFSRKIVDTFSVHAAITAYLRHMRAAGFVVTRVEGEIGQIHPQHIYAAGWNACRAATLANAVEVPE